MRAVATLLIILASASWAHAQDRPFIFSFTPPPDTSTPHVRIDYDFGVGEQTFHQDSQNGPEQRIGLQASSGRFTFIGHAGLASAGASYDTFSQAELLVSVFALKDAGVSVAAGGGVLHEPGGGNVLLARVVAGRLSKRTQLQGNLLFQRAFEAGRDALDLITTIGWAARVTDTISLGAEGIGEDLEGFWNPHEAEGGARVLVGPSLHIAPPGRRWQTTLVGGPAIHATTSDRTSEAIRDLPQTTVQRTGYAMRLSFSCMF